MTTIRLTEEQAAKLGSGRSKPLSQQLTPEQLDAELDKLLDQLDRSTNAVQRLAPKPQSTGSGIELAHAMWGIGGFMLGFLTALVFIGR